MKRFNCTLSDKRGAFRLCMEEHKEGMFVPFSEVEVLNQRINQLLEERHRTGIAISNAIRSGTLPDKHPLRSRLELLANHRKREQELADGMVAMADRCTQLADLLREAKESVYFQLESPDSRLTGDEAGKLIDLQERIDAALAGKLPEPALPQLSHEEHAALVRFNQCCEDSQGYDVDKDMMIKLARKGALHHRSAGYYEVTEAGSAMLATALKPQGENRHTPEPVAWLCKGTRTITLEQVVADDWRRKRHIAIPLYEVPVEIQNLSREAKESLQAMIDYCLRHGIAMGMDEGFKHYETEQKHSFRLELEAFCGLLAAAPKSEGSQAKQRMPELDDDLRLILGRANFSCAIIATSLRRAGHKIERKAEHEQAAVIHWLLGFYFSYGNQWAKTAEAALKEIGDTTKPKGGEPCAIASPLCSEG